MSRTKIKICGLTRPQDIEYVNEALPDYIGFVFAKSKRQVTAETATKLKSVLDSRIMSVGVFVNEHINVVTSLCNTGVIDYVQLHGDEDEEYLSALRQEISNPIIKAIRVKDADSLKELRAKNMVSRTSARQLPYEFLLLDSYSDIEFGGSGKTFNWEFTKDIAQPFFLAGGIHLDNAMVAVENIKPYCIDVSSGVETSGVKDRHKILQLINEVRSVR